MPKRSKAYKDAIARTKRGGTHIVNSTRAARKRGDSVQSGINAGIARSTGDIKKGSRAPSKVVSHKDYAAYKDNSRSFEDGTRRSVKRGGK